MAKKERENVGKKKKRGILKKIFIFILILFIIGIGIATAFVFDKLNKIKYTDLNEKNLEVSSNVDSKYRNIALLAVDSRDVNNTKGSRSDGIIILSLNKESKEIRLISVYRDTYLDVEGHGLTKVTHAYAYGGPELAINTLNRNLDLNISEFATVNFEIVANIIDAMDGIEINVKQSELAQMNKYIRDTSKHTGISSPLLTHSGKQTLNGVQAVTYGRIRKLAGGDYARTERMRTVIMAAFEKAKTMNISELNKIIDTVLPQIQTNISGTEILGLAAQIGSYKIVDNVGWPFDTKGITLNAWYGVPVTLKTNVEKLHKECFDNPEYTAPDSVRTISNKIINKTGYTASTSTD